MGFETTIMVNTLVPLQVCRMQIESFGYNTDDLLFFWDTSSNTSDTIDMGSGLELPQFRILGHRTADCTKNYTSGSYTCIKGNSKSSKAA